MWRGVAGAIAIMALASGADLQLPAKFQSVADLAGKAPPEFGARALLDLLDTRGIDDGATRRALIERAYELAGQAHDRWQLRSLTGDAQAAGAVPLDQLSLQLHAVRLMLALDKARARELFAGIPKPAPQPLTCADRGAPDLTDFYAVLGQVINETFSPEQRRNDEPVHMAGDYLGAIDSPVQFEPALRMVEGLHVTPDQRHQLLVELASAINGISADDRSFTAVSGAMASRLPPELTAAWQHFVAGHPAAEHCTDSRQPSTQTADEKRIAADARNVLYNGGVRVPRAEQAGPGFQERLEDFLAEVSDWQQGPDESDASFYHRKIGVYCSLLDVTAPPLRARVVDDMLRFALSSPLERDAPAEWFFDLRSADERVRHSTSPGPDVKDGFVRSGDPVLILDAELEKVLGR